MNDTEVLKQRINELETTIKALQETISTLADASQTPMNKDGLPVGLKIQADVEGVGEVWLRVDFRNYQVDKIAGQQIVEGKRFNSLSSAAEFFSNIKRKSGWVYWRTSNGRTLKDAYKG